MQVPSHCICPVCWQRRDDVACVTPCLHHLCYGCAFGWAQKKPTCAVCGHRIKTIRYSVRSDDDYLECSVPQPAEHSARGLQDARGPAEPALVAPQHRFAPEVWAAFFQGNPGNLEALYLWLEAELERISGDEWWMVLAAQNTVVSALCTCGLDEAALVRVLRPFLNSLTESFVRRLITAAAAIYGPELRRQQDRRNGRAARGQQDSPAATPQRATFHLGPPASGPGRSASPAGPSTQERPSVLPEGPAHTATTAVPSQEPQQEPRQQLAAGPSAQGRDCSHEGPRRPPKRRASTSPHDSPPSRSRRPQHSHHAGTPTPARARRRRAQK